MPCLKIEMASLNIEMASLRQAFLLLRQDSFVLRPGIVCIKANDFFLREDSLSKYCETIRRNNAKLGEIR